jgi:hypothetical protein
MGLISGPKIANGKCGKTTNAGTMDRGSTVFHLCHSTKYSFQGVNFHETYTVLWNKVELLHHKFHPNQPKGMESAGRNAVDTLSKV